MATRPYGDIVVIMQYLSNVKVSQTTIQKILDRQATDIESVFHLNGAEFPADYVYLNVVKDIAELQTACQGHLTYGKREDAKWYCDLAAKKLLSLKGESDVVSEVDGDIFPVELETYPANPVGHKLEGRSKQ